jgi:hypothetical protein
MEPKVFLNHKVSRVTGGKTVEGHKFGIELELEGRNVGLQDIAVRGWGRHMDGSLRGEAIEYTTIGAKSLDEAKKCVVELFEKFSANKVKLNESIRTSTHVHLNFSDKPVKQAINFFTLFTLLEEVLQYYSGEDRKGNNFCISTREADGVVGVLALSIGRGDLSSFAADRFKYAACNLSTLYKFGTIEVRTMRGAQSAEMVNAWLDILNDMYNYATNVMVSPAKLVTDLSVLGAEGLMRAIFSPKNLKELMLHFPPIQTLHYSLMEGARLVQVFAYEHDEAFKADVELPKEAELELENLPVGKGNISVWTVRGERLQIYLPDGTPWNVFARNGRDVFRNGEALEDRGDCRWSTALQRFVMSYPGGRKIPCRWVNHDRFGNEGPPNFREALPHDDDDEDDMDQGEEEMENDF